MSSVIRFIFLFVVLGSYSLHASEFLQKGKNNLYTHNAGAKDEKQRKTTIPSINMEDKKEDKEDGNIIDVEKIDTKKSDDYMHNLENSESTQSFELGDEKTNINGNIEQEQILENKEENNSVSQSIFRENENIHLGEEENSLPVDTDTNVQEQLRPFPTQTEIPVPPKERREENRDKNVQENKDHQQPLQDAKNSSNSDTMSNTIKFKKGKELDLEKKENELKKKDASTEKSLKRWTELKKEPEPVKEWMHKERQNELIHKQKYDSLNEHLPSSVFIHDYNKQFFHCIKKNDISCMRSIINKLEKIGLNMKEILKFKNNLGDTPLIHAVRQGEVDTVRFLLLQGADPRVVDNHFQSAIDIAIKRKHIGIINAITEMVHRSVEQSKVAKDSSYSDTKNNSKKCSDK